LGSPIATIANVWHEKNNHQKPTKTMLKKILLFTTFCLLCLPIHAQKLAYTISFAEPHTHYCEVQITFEGFKRNFIDFKMPVWAPGSYLIREFSKGVEQEKAIDGKGKALKCEKISKNTWRVYTENVEKVVFTYSVYAFELSVRTSFIDASHGYLNGTSIFMYPNEFLQTPSTLSIKPHQSWKEISTGLSPVADDKFVLKVPNYDILADSPIELGNQKIYKFQAVGVAHEVAVYGGGNYDEDRFTADITKIIEETTKIFGENPCKTPPFDHYTFIVHSVSRGGGGLEHLNSTTLMQPRFSYQGSGYEGFLSLVAHEYFHLWNVKRLRPKPLGPFDYDNENYTRLLWVAEGVTSYYDNLITYRAGYMEASSYMQSIVNVIANHENAAGSMVQSVAESSFDAWIKGYRPNENTKNSSISYYSSGTVMASLLDLEIIAATKAQKSLDDVMRYMYEEYYKKKNIGFTDAEFQQACEKMAGKPLTIFKHIYSTEAIDYNKFLEMAGLRLNKSMQGNISLGANLADEDGRVIVKSTDKGTASYNGGLNVNDEIIAVDGFRMPSAGFANSYFSSKNQNEKVQVLISRDNLMQTLTLTMGVTGAYGYRMSRLDKTNENQEAIYRKWMGGKN
jgi:predicted metalloprotease with PDZ domain